MAVRKYLDIPDILAELKATGFSRTAQLLLLSLIAYHYEKKRARGFVRGNRERSIFEDQDSAGDTITYTIRINENDLMNKFGFSKDTLIRIRRLMNSLMGSGRLRVRIKTVGIISKSIRMKRSYFERFNWKYMNLDLEYKIKIIRKGLESIRIPIRVLYDKSRKYSEKLATIWHVSLKDSLSRTPTQREVATASGISERTIGKAKNKYPEFFTKVSV